MVQVSLLIAGLICLLLGLTVFLSNPKQTLFRLYFGASALATLWILVNSLTTTGPITLSGSKLLFTSRLITPLSLAESIIYLCFVDYFTHNRIHKKNLFLIIPSLAVSAFSFTSSNVYLTKTGQANVGSLYPFYALVIALNIAAIFIALYRSERQSSKNHVFKAQLSYIRTGTTLTLIPMLLLGVVLPLFSNSQISDISPLFLVVFLLAAGLSIVRYRLFDLRLLATRSTAYVLSLASLIALFSLVVFGITNMLVHGQNVRTVESSVRWISAVLATLLAVSFGYIKKFFDEVTSKIFYRDAYDSQMFIDDLNRTIIDNIELGILLRRIASVIKQNLKCDFVVFGIFDEANDRMRFIDDTGVAKIPNFQHISRIAGSMHERILNYDDFEYPNRDSDFKTMMGENDISIIAKLSENHTTQRRSNLLLIGPKKSGNSYNSQDLRIIEIVANELVIAIQNALRFEEIQKFNSTLQERIDQATRKLRTVNEKLRALDEAKDDFISMASHQLRTPLTSVKGYISMVVEGDTGEITEQQHKLLSQAYSSSQRMVYIIADLLNVSRLRTGKFVMEPTPINLADVVEEEVYLLKETAEVHQLELDYDKPKDFPILMIDETKTRQVIMNYIDNAIYYTPVHGKIRIILEDKGATIEFRVVDNGIGVPASEKHHLFSKFYRAGNARKARPDGTGLGLFMAKKVIIAQGGAIIFDSTEGKGSTFGFIFSKAKLAQDKADN